MSAAGRPIPEAIREQAAQWLARNKGDHPADAEGEFQVWLAQDLRHRLAYAAIERAWAESSLLAKTRLGLDRKLARAPIHMRRSTHIAALSAVIILGVGFTSVQFMHGLPSVGIGTSVQARTYETRPGETRTWRLADGTSLMLGSASFARASLGSDSPRIELERGSARLIFVKTNARPTEVTVAGLSVRTAEGALDVAAAPGRSRIDVVTGTAEAIAADGLRQTLHAGQGVGSPAPAGSPPIISVSEAPHAVLAMNEMTIEQAIAFLNRSNVTQIHLANADLATRHLAGAFRTDDPEAFANSVAALENVEVERRDRSIILRTR